jgi:transcriptional regulator with XRE-family HTH domain
MDIENRFRLDLRASSPSPSQLSQVELGKNAASICALVRIAEALGLRVSDLLSDV